MSLTESIVEDAPSNGSGSWAVRLGTGRSSRPVNRRRKKKSSRMEVLQLTANQFIRPMGAGRTCPVLLGAEDPEGKTVEVVTKLRGPELSAKAQIAELVAAPQRTRGSANGAASSQPGATPQVTDRKWDKG